MLMLSTQPVALNHGPIYILHYNIINTFEAVAESICITHCDQLQQVGT